MSYTKLVKQWKKESNIKWKALSIQAKKDQFQAEKLQTMIICSNMIEQIKNQETQTKNNIIRGEIILSLRTKNPFTYPQYLIIWDMLNSDFNQILHDLGKGKISQTDITNSINYISEFSNTLIDEYWKQTLLNA